jgi:hypothetical protein
VDDAAPQRRATPEPFVSAIRQGLAGRTAALEDLAVELYARGLSTRETADTFQRRARASAASRALSDLVTGVAPTSAAASGGTRSRTYQP